MSLAMGSAGGSLGEMLLTLLFMYVHALTVQFWTSGPLLTSPLLNGNYKNSFCGRAISFIASLRRLIYN
jgi:uncharacterized membrane protein YedE/YeeE